MIIDTHVHVFPPEVVARINDYLDRDPFLEMICTSPAHKYASAEDLLAEMDSCGVNKALVSGFACSHAGLCREMNDYVLNAARKHPRRILPMATLSFQSTSKEERKKEIDRCLDLGAVGVGELFPWGQGFNLEGDTADELAGLCREREIPLLLHVNEEVGHYYPGKGEVSVKEAYAFALKHPELRIIYAHWGGGLFFYELMPQLKEQLKNVYYDTAAGPFLYRKEVYRVARETGVLHKILLGTDYPLITPRRSLREIKEAGLTEEEVKAIQGGNARKLLQL